MSKHYVVQGRITYLSTLHTLSLYQPNPAEARILAKEVIRECHGIAPDNEEAKVEIVLVIESDYPMQVIQS